MTVAVILAGGSRAATTENVPTAAPLPTARERDDDGAEGNAAKSLVYTRPVIYATDVSTKGVNAGPAKVLDCVARTTGRPSGDGGAAGRRENVGDGDGAREAGGDAPTLPDGDSVAETVAVTDRVLKSDFDSDDDDETLAVVETL